MSRREKHAGQLAFPVVDAPNCTGADNLVRDGRAQKQCAIAVCSFRVVDIPKPCMDEFAREGIRMIAEMFLPDGFNEPSDLSRVAGPERPDDAVRYER